MVSRRNFFSILVMMAVLLFMFQFSSVIKENESDFDLNVYAMDEAIPIRWESKVMQKPDKADVGAENAAQEGTVQNGAVREDFVVFYGNKDGAVRSVVEQWCGYTKRGMIACGSLDEYSVTDGVEGRLPEVVLVDSGEIDLVKNLQAFKEMTEEGIILVFCNLPDPSVIQQSRELRKLLGIQQVMEEQVEVEGIHLLRGFLLGGEVRYIVEREEDEKRQDLQLTVPWYVTAGGTKTYMAGILDEMLKDNDAKNEYSPALVWRNGYGKSRIFVVNGDYLSHAEGIGLLDGMMYEADTYDVYPVVNAQNVIVTNYPDFAGENEAAMRLLYSRNADAVQRDICWPDLSTLVEKNKLKLTCMFTPQYDYQDGIEPEGDGVAFYLQQFRETDAEAGLSLDYGEEISLTEKLERDGQFYRTLDNSYLYSSAFVDAEQLRQLEEVMPAVPLLDNIRTIACDYREDRPVVSWRGIAEEGTSITLQSVTSNAKTHTYSNDFFVRSLETALGYSNVRIDMHDVVWPEEEEDRWENFYDDVSSNLNTYWKAFSVFSKTTLTESDRRIRSFLNLDYRDRREGDRIYLEISGTEECWFILRVHGEEIVTASGADYQEIEGGAYLLHVTGQAVEVELQSSRGQLKYTYP